MNENSALTKKASERSLMPSTTKGCSDNIIYESGNESPPNTESTSTFILDFPQDYETYLLFVSTPVYGILLYQPTWNKIMVFDEWIIALYRSAPSFWDPTERLCGTVLRIPIKEYGSLFLFIYHLLYHLASGLPEIVCKDMDKNWQYLLLFP